MRTIGNRAQLGVVALTLLGWYVRPVTLGPSFWSVTVAP